ncbi:hypothetical protein Zm00014a_014279 [Zea mays]|uniref:SDE2/SF3A3 SAP domain-containing protein n=1 Tax=Zea mays TaxID=4577 RepID=A0A3L6DM17_MAIZE|nr:hypothetical protein Zm00014a_014279 [Zea mays]
MSSSRSTEELWQVFFANPLDWWGNRTNKIREYHRRNPSARFVSTTDDYEELLKEEPGIEFTGELESEFEERWANGEIPGWGNKGTEKEFGIDLDYYSTALSAQGLKSGGTVQQRADRLFLLKVILKTPMLM